MDEVKWCFVPTCLNSTKNSVNKWFVPIPSNQKRRQMWFQAVNRNFCFDSERSSLYCCSDHFNLTEDTCSFFERDGEVVLKLKKSIVPCINSPGKKGFISGPQGPRQTIHLTGKKRLVTPGPNPIVPQTSNDDFLSLIDTTSSEEDDSLDEVGVVTSESLNKLFLSQKNSGSTYVQLKNIDSKIPTLSPSKVSSKDGGPTKRRVKKVIVKDQFDMSGNSQHKVKRHHKTSSAEAMKSLFVMLRKAIPSIANQQALTREQILDETIEFICQMRNKSDKRQGSMHCIMESNATLTARIQHLEHLIALHENNDIVLTKDIVNRRLGAVTASSLNRTPKLRSKR